MSHKDTGRSTRYKQTAVDPLHNSSVVQKHTGRFAWDKHTAVVPFLLPNLHAFVHKPGAVGGDNSLIGVMLREFLHHIEDNGVGFLFLDFEMPFLILYSLIAVIFSIASLSITMCDYYSITKRDCQH